MPENTHTMGNSNVSQVHTLGHPLKQTVCVGTKHAEKVHC